MTGTKKPTSDFFSTKEPARPCEHDAIDFDAIVSAYDWSPPPVKRLDVDPALAGAINAFGFDLWARVRSAPRSGNLAVSPMSVSLALAMAWGGARGETAAQMARVLRIAVHPDALHEAAGRLVASMNAPRPGATVAVANRLFGDRGVAFEEPFLALARDRYGAELERLDFRNASEQSRGRINDWVAESTRGRIVDVLPAGSLDADARLVLVNALYMRAPWQEPFEPSATSLQPFHVSAGASPRVPTMHQAEWMGYASARGVHAVELAYPEPSLDSPQTNTPTEHSGRALIWSPRGRLLDERERSYEWSAWGDPRRIDAPEVGSVQILHDHVGRLVRRESAETTLDILADDCRVVGDVIFDAVSAESLFEMSIPIGDQDLASAHEAGSLWGPGYFEDAPRSAIQVLAFLLGALMASSIRAARRTRIVPLMFGVASFLASGFLVIGCDDGGQSAMLGARLEINDWQASPTLVMDDAAVTRFSFLTYGRAVAGTPMDIAADDDFRGFVAGEHLVGEDLFDLGRRVCSPELSMFLSADPLFLERLDREGEAPLALEVFAFGRANPIRYSDPWGEEANDPAVLRAQETLRMLDAFEQRARETGLTVSPVPAPSPTPTPSSLQQLMPAPSSTPSSVFPGADQSPAPPYVRLPEPDSAASQRGSYGQPSGADGASAPSGSSLGDWLRDLRERARDFRSGVRERVGAGVDSARSGVNSMRGSVSEVRSKAGDYASMATAPGAIAGFGVSGIKRGVDQVMDNPGPTGFAPIDDLARRASRALRVVQTSR